MKSIEIKIDFSIVKKGETFIKRNKRNNKEYFIIDGVSRSYLINPEGEDITISFFTKNAIISPFSTRTENEISILNFQALTELKIATIDAALFEQLMLDNKEIRNFGNKVLRNELKQKTSKEIGLASLSAKERLQSFRKDYRNLENLIPHTIIATYLGITNISLSRLRGDLAK
ncbi:Crp/Fnr family transcriptional regulator [Tenacibaculum haliotis]|uniref:Crp/Fnr family transcriptional regulator n=1 Tax=Tenacibaculum haliotis TaxID=1888914 RepID=UPI0021AF867D|nr:Crp/Fnr family transcriptional regulator [Tenacibaculum haliotis]MCT4698957.1 Crp/Fnr family transcriptional regulator [Tenacibaculum haliotis]